ncbi:MAG: class I SAM-dependent methyltransferase [Paracoccaceae bacterium]
MRLGEDVGHVPLGEDFGRVPLGEDFGLDAAGYDAGRPDEPAALYDAVAAEAGPIAGARVLEIGAGTGRATRVLLARGATSVHAVEPDPRMAARLVGLDRVTREIARFETANPGRGYDLAVAASAFHWVAEPAAALGRLRAMLAPGGGVALWYAVHADPDGPDAFARALAPFWAEAASGHELRRRQGAGPPSEARGCRRLGAAGFERVRHHRLAWTVEQDATALAALYASFSPVRALAPDARRRLLEAVGRLAREDFGGRVRRRYAVTLFTARAPERARGPGGARGLARRPRPG